MKRLDVTIFILRYSISNINTGWIVRSVSTTTSYFSVVLLNTEFFVWNDLQRISNKCSIGGQLCHFDIEIYPRGSSGVRYHKESSLLRIISYVWHPSVRSNALDVNKQLIEKSWKWFLIWRNLFSTKKSSSTMHSLKLKSGIEEHFQSISIWKSCASMSNEIRISLPEKLLG